MFRIKNGIAVLTSIAALAFLGTGCTEESATKDTLLPVSDPMQAAPRWSVVPQTDLNGFFDCLDSEGITLVAAHRGGEVENSLAGMADVLDQVPAVMEVDVNISADGVLFLMHDDTLERTTTGTGAAGDHDWRHISTLTIEGPDGTHHDAPPRLEDALAWADGRTILELDIKRGVPYEALVETVKNAGASDRVIYIAYTAGQAQRLHELHPQVMISAGISSPQDLDELIAMGIPGDRILGWTGTREPDQALFDLLGTEDIEVLFGTLGGEDSIDTRIARTGAEDYYAQLAQSGVDLIATDRPVAAFEAMKKAGLNVSSPACGIVDNG